MLELIIYFLIINYLCVFLSAYDKYQARISGRRVSESTLLFFASIGGATCMYIIMRIIHHKTRKKKFMVVLPILIFLHIVLFVSFLYFKG